LFERGFRWSQTRSNIFRHQRTLPSILLLKRGTYCCIQQWWSLNKNTIFFQTYNNGNDAEQTCWPRLNVLADIGTWKMLDPHWLCWIYKIFIRHFTTFDDYAESFITFDDCICGRVIIEHTFPKSQAVDTSVLSDDNSQLRCERDTTIPEKYKQNFDVLSEGLWSGRSFINEMSLETSKFSLYFSGSGISLTSHLSSIRNQSLK
jgi:hypothetical protein